MFLPKRINPKAGESLYSYIFRTAKENCYGHLSDIMPNVGPKGSLYRSNLNYLKENSIWQNEFVKLMQFIGLDVSDFVLNKFNRLLFTKEPSLFQQRQHFYNARAKYCPLCLKEDFYHRLLWDVSTVTVCLKHGNFLVERCPKCKKKISLSRLMLGCCHCGIIFENIKEGNAQPNNYILESQEIIQTLLLSKNKEVRISNGEKLNGNEYFDLLDLLSKLMDGFAGEHPLCRISGLNVKQVNHLLKIDEPRDVKMISLISTAAHQLLVNPEEFFSMILKGIHTDNSRYKKSFLKTIINHKKGDIFRQFYIEFLNDLNNEYVNRKKIVRTNVKQKKYLTLSETEELLGSTYYVVTRLCESGILTLHKTYRGSEEVMLIEMESVQTWMKKRNELLDIHQTANLLGLYHRRVQELARFGLLRSAQISEDRHRKWLFDRKDIEDFLTDLFDKCERRTTINEDWVPFKKSIHLIKKAHVDHLKMIQMILSGTFKTCVVDAEFDFKGLYIFKEDIKMFLEEIYNKRIKDIGYTTTEVASMCKVGHQRVLDWIDQGYLTAKKHQNQNRQMSIYIDKKQVEQILLSI